MDNFEIILIEGNDFNVDTIKSQKTPNYSENEKKDLLTLKSNYINFEESLGLIKQHCKSITVNKESFMEEVVKFIGLDEEHYGDVKDCYECKDYTYQVMFKVPHNEDKLDRIKNNMIASLITFDKQLVRGNAVLFKTYISIDKPNEDRVIDTKLTNVIDLLMNNYYHTGVYVNPQNKFEQIYFNNKYEIIDPHNNWQKLSNIGNILTDEKYGFQLHEYLKFNLKFVFDTKSEDELNEPMSRLLHGIIKGDGVIISPYSENSFYELTVDDIIDMLKVWNMLDNSTEDTLKIENKEKTKYQILKNRIDRT
tara:strand:- start:4769 stop:5692 length:924 start_codon:yes stop_codon:yes gene_type:complete